MLTRLYKNITSNLADALNRSADRFVEDITAQVPILTGKLQKGYRITKRARPDSLSIRIGPSESYGAKYYPFTNNFGRRQAQRPERVRFFGKPESTFEARRIQVVKTELRSIQKQRLFRPLVMLVGSLVSKSIKVVKR